jgi:hypothetical protein
MVVGAVVFLTLTSIGWILAMPFGGYPDEIDHYGRSASLASGVLVGGENPALETTPEPEHKSCCGPGNPTALFWVESGVRLVELPRTLDPSRLACVVVVAGPRARCEVEAPAVAPPRATTMGTIEPLGYLAPGLAMALARNYSLAFRLGRFANVAVGVLAIGLVLAGTANRRLPIRLVGLCLACTPMVIFVLSSGSPNALEIAGALGAWLAMLEVTSEDGPSSIPLWCGGVLSAVLLASSRSIGPLWLLAIVGVGLVLRGPVPLMRVIRTQPRRALGAGLIVGAACLTTVAWEVIVQPSVAFDAGFALRQIGPAMSDTSRISHELIGAFGSLDIPLPGALVAGWQMLVAAAAGCALWWGNRRARSAVILVSAMTVASVALLGAGVLRQNGFAMQGRHVLPLALGIPLVAVEALRGREWKMRGFFGGIAVICVPIQIYAWAFAARSFGRTVDGLVVVPAFDGSWTPPLAQAGGALVLIGCLSLGFVVFRGLWQHDLGDR